MGPKSQDSRPYEEGGERSKTQSGAPRDEVGGTWSEPHRAPPAPPEIRRGKEVFFGHPADRV